MRIRKTFPQVYALESPDKGKYWLVWARSTKWGLNQRKIFSAEELALNYARDLEAQVVQNGKQSDIPKEKPQAALSYEIYTSEETKRLLPYVAGKEKDLIGYSALQTFRTSGFLTDRSFRPWRAGQK